MAKPILTLLFYALLVKAKFAFMSTYASLTPLIISLIVLMVVTSDGMILLTITSKTLCYTSKAQLSY